MVTEVRLNGVRIEVSGYEEEIITDFKTGSERYKINFDFKLELLEAH